jgi:hypothetical protein
MVKMKRKPKDSDRRKDSKCRKGRECRRTSVTADTKLDVNSGDTRAQSNSGVISTKIKESQLTEINFVGVAKDGSFVFNAIVLPDYAAPITFKITQYDEDKIMVIDIDSKESNIRVAEFISGLFADIRFSNLKNLVVNYKERIIEVKRYTLEKDIEYILKDIKQSGDATDFSTGSKKQNDGDKYDFLAESSKDQSFYFEWLLWKSMMFISYSSDFRICISSLKNGIISVDLATGEDIKKFLFEECSKFFNEKSNFYGIKGIEVEFNKFAICIDEQNYDRIWSLYARSDDIRSALRE